MSQAAQQKERATATYSHAFRREAEVRELPRGHLEVLMRCSAQSGHTTRPARADHGPKPCEPVYDPGHAVLACAPRHGQYRHCTVARVDQQVR
jgi:hypothetical protein